eukprot:gnl/Chilomastix_cuspidata/2251.p1 GENE.gnl/Chilomastix_cuspidata/2251~~gnl/Chilomastix_cuspidata/2251.p1  ORF type:complete len:426 (+),score=148.46 gnl/Chilomastix_cuspidata/2251:67-1278(+)
MGGSQSPSDVDAAFQRSASKRVDNKRMWMILGITFAAVVVVIVVVLLLVYLLPSDPEYTVVATKSGVVLIDQTRSDFDFNYNSAAWTIERDGETRIALAVRTQNATAETVGAVGASSIVYTESADPAGAEFAFVDYDNAILLPGVVTLADGTLLDATLGVEDPRVWYHEGLGLHYMHYTAVRELENGDCLAQLAWATSDDGRTFTPRGLAFDEEGLWSKSGAVLPAQLGGEADGDVVAYLLWGDDNITIATTYKDDLSAWEDIHEALLSVRADHFDSVLVESGPAPIQLRDGNWLFLYNSANVSDTESAKAGWFHHYNIGWAVLDGDDPRNVIARSEEPIVSPEYKWETCNYEWDDEYPPLTPFVVFAEGWWQTRNDEGNEEFTVVYQGCDAYTSTFTLTVTY